MTKITILTHRLGHNYGGMLQAFALQRYLGSISPNSKIYTISLHRQTTPARRVINTLGVSLKRRRVFVDSLQIKHKIEQETGAFLLKYVQRADGLSQNSDLYVVGSDQVWRASYVDPVKYMFSDIINDELSRISYAASFGTDDLSEYTPEQIQATAKLAKKFSGISVREESGVAIVKDNWGLDALHHVDPTLLLNASDYSKVIDDEPTAKLEGSLFAYVLDRSLSNNAIIEKIEELTNLKQFELMPKEYRSYIDFLRNKEAYIMPKVEQWLRSFRDAEFVVTDSFHGTVFSIIFNKPFIAVGNKARGLARFTSLLSMFGLEHRLVSAPEQVTKKLVDEKINWTAVNKKIKAEQDRSMEYLKKHLSKEA